MTAHQTPVRDTRTSLSILMASDAAPRSLPTLHVTMNPGRPTQAEFESRNRFPCGTAATEGDARDFPTLAAVRATHSAIEGVRRPALSRHVEIGTGHPRHFQGSA